MREDMNSEEIRRGRRASKASSTSMVAEKLGPKASLLLRAQLQEFPLRCHASTNP